MKRIAPLMMILLTCISSACARASQPATSDLDQPISATPGGNPSGTEMPAPWEPKPSDINLQRGDAFIDEEELLVLESFPPQFRLQLQGTTPTPCHQLRVKVNPPSSDQQISVEVYSLSKPDEICVQVLEPFEVSVPLQDLTAGTYSVIVNRNLVGEIEVP